MFGFATASYGTQASAAPTRAPDPPTGGSASHPRGEMVGIGLAGRHAGLVLSIPHGAVFFPGDCIAELTRAAPPVVCAPAYGPGARFARRG